MFLLNQIQSLGRWRQYSPSPPETSQQIYHSMRQNHKKDDHIDVAHLLADGHFIDFINVERRTDFHLGVTLQTDATIAISLFL